MDSHVLIASFQIDRPLRLPLDTSVVEKMSRMASLNLGSVQSISDKLRYIIESADYIKAAAKGASGVEIAVENHSVIPISIFQLSETYLDVAAVKTRRTSQLLNLILTIISLHFIC